MSIRDGIRKHKRIRVRVIRPQRRGDGRWEIRVIK